MPSLFFFADLTQVIPHDVPSSNVGWAECNEAQQEA
jgi:hypothetical protein